TRFSRDWSSDVCSSDLFHRVDASSLLTNADRMRLDAIVESVDCIWLSGNHDPAPHAIGGACLPELDLDGLLFTHEPRKGKTGLRSEERRVGEEGRHRGA